MKRFLPAFFASLALASCAATPTSTAQTVAPAAATTPPALTAPPSVAPAATPTPAPTTAPAAAPLSGAIVRESHPGQAQFARELAAELGPQRTDRSEAQINAILDDARKQPAIIAAMTRPAEAKPWRDYRPIFMTEARIAGGARFWREHASLLEPIAARYGVPPEIIVAIIGVETSYGGNTGSWRALDALATLAFHYPPRAPYFRGELKRLLSLPAGTFPMPLGEIKGSYAGAMGMPQFMPTSYATWAVDEDADGRIDLWSSDADVFASVAKYFIDHGWEPGQPVGHLAQVASDARTLEPEGFQPVYTVDQLAQWGYRIDATQESSRAATLVRFEGAEGPEFWVTYRNFFVITRYNRSPMYALAVYQLAGAIADRHDADAAP